MLIGVFNLFYCLVHRITYMSLHCTHVDKGAELIQSSGTLDNRYEFTFYSC